MLNDIPPLPTNIIDPSISWEVNGVLAKASNQGALFSLYLAMQQHALAEPIRIESEALENTDKTQLTALNHYRRPALNASQEDWHNMDVLARLIAVDVPSARLFQSLNPGPLAQIDDKSRLSDDIVNNCSLGTRKRIKRAYSSDVKEDNTLLYDVINADNNAFFQQKTA